MDHRRLLSPTGTTLEPLEKHVYQKLKRFRSQLEKQKLIVAVSGGIDSVVLLHVLHSLRSRFNFHLHVAHINHGVRGPESDSDSRFVSQLSKQLKVPLLQRKLRGMKITAGENLLRQKRYEALFEMRDKIKATFIATAHHQDDLLETRLMRLLQGTGIHGLKAMAMLNEERILRPLLSVARRDIERYARTKNLDWRNDATNHDTTKFRNWIRRNWLGILRLEHPEYVQNLYNSLERLIQNNALIAAAQIPQTFDRSWVHKGLNEVELDHRVYSYLRHHCKARVTSRHVAEFRKQISSKRKRFVFRLAGMNWQVEKTSVQPA